MGWNSIDKKGHSTNSTIGNNVFAQENHFGSDYWVSNKRPVSPESAFIYPISDWSDPYSYVNSSISNVFYWINLLHDILYTYGFDEPAGNFQNKNFLRGGKGFDAIIADVQDGSGDSNASFMSPPDGQHGRMRLFLWSKNRPARDGGLESCIIVHEYVHGLTSRLTGGPSNADCLSFGEAGGMGEGWGDFFSILLRINGSTPRDASFGIGEYSNGETSSNIKGIRTHPYGMNSKLSCSFIDSITYSSIRKEMRGIHAIGEVWAQTLYDVYWSLIEDCQFTAHNPFWDDGKKSQPKGPNDIMLGLLIEGMKLQPCWPTFVDARDAILAAEKLRYKQLFRCSLWRGFASRGLGIKALPGGKECFLLPEDCTWNI
ncbi:hypothetical protein DI09_36p90 [Mitosporidium daphniae]|uniref:Extracellular metalloproteinase n=1 Tax=Mitosporidium daphniae TaxID=1485682 RepID=A0A098VQV1_9MICR|nr:uncharacterized protein DI09_36p90 [Mitosporidium daphniae]KGG51398.1 hypothetical protein DI09_36p90 [Mitosporidium daphniae]|eukprot:XP_013237842.1 uncharacterized protein DI09_36p90 [Mitosporidium daphniae]